MRRNKLALYVHLVWATWDRLPLILPDVERRLYRNIESEVRKMGCVVLALNGTVDHVHLVISTTATIAIADLVKQIKGVSSHFVNEVLRPETQFKWQGGYGAFTVSRWDLPIVVGYVKKQKEHHRADDLLVELEEAFEIVGTTDQSTA
jgi:REP element-mobilizing transposase RayT